MKLATSLLLPQFTCANLAAKPSAVNLLDSGVLNSIYHDRDH